VALHHLPRQGGLADLTRAGENHGFAGQVAQERCFQFPLNPTDCLHSGKKSRRFILVVLKSRDWQWRPCTRTGQAASAFQLLQPAAQILSALKIQQGQGQLLQLREREGVYPGAGGGLKGSATALQQPQGQVAGLAAAAFLQALLQALLQSLLPSKRDPLLPPKLNALLSSQRSALLAPFLSSFLQDVLEGAGVAPEVFGDAEGGHDLLVGKTLKAFRKNRQDQLDQIRPPGEDALGAGPEIRLFLHRQGEQGERGIEIGLAAQSGEIHPGHVLLEEALQGKGLAGAEGQALVGQKHQHLQMLHLPVLLQEPEGFRRQAAMEVPIGVHLHLQEHHRKLGTATGVLAGPEHAIGMVGHLFEGDRPEVVGGFGVPSLCGGQPRQEATHQIGQGSEYLRIPVIALQGG
jgi:hypothetical protein